MQRGAAEQTVFEGLGKVMVGVVGSEPGDDVGEKLECLFLPDYSLFVLERPTEYLNEPIGSVVRVPHLLRVALGGSPHVGIDTQLVVCCHTTQNLCYEGHVLLHVLLDR